MAAARVDLSETVSSLRLLDRARGGDRVALDLLVRRYLPRIRRWAHRRLPTRARDVTDTEDIVQDAMLRTLRQLDSVDPQREGTLQAYLRQAVLNRIRDELRRAERTANRTPLTDRESETGESPLEALIGAEAVTRYEAALARLRQEDREAIVTRLELGGSYAEVAIALKKPTANAARVAVSRAVVRLAEEMRRDG